MKNIDNNGTIRFDRNKTVYVGSLMGLTFRNGKMIVNGVENDAFEEATKDQKAIYITIEGNVDHLDIECCDTIKIHGNAGHVKTNMGDISVEGDVDGDVHTNMGNIHCGEVGGNVHTNMGDIQHVVKEGDGQ